MRLVYEIATTGQDQLRSVLRGVEREAAASDKRLETQRRSSAKTLAREQSGLMHGPGRREQMAGIRQSERAQASANARLMREQAAARRLQERQSALAIKSEERARIASERNLARARESLDRQRSRALLRLHSESERAAERVSAGRRRFAGRVSEGMARSVGGAVGTAAAIGGTAVGVAGGFAAAEALRERSAIQRKASALANAAAKPGQDLGSLKAQLGDEAERVRGFTGTETLGAMQAFVGKTGDLDAARGAIQDLGKLALATESDFESLGETAGNAFNVLADAIEDPNERLKALKKVMAGWAGQGNIGAVELKDLAQFGGRLGASTRKFAGDPSDLLIKMGAMAQAAVRAGGASDAAEATTGVARFAADLTKKPAQKALTALGIDIFAGPGKKGSKTYQSKLADPSRIIADILEKTKGSLPANEDIVNAESGKVLGGFADLYNKAEQKKRGTGRKAVLDEFQRYERASLSSKAVEEQAASRLSDPDQQLKAATKEFNNAVGRELVPVAIQLAHHFAELVPLAATLARMFTRFIGFVSDNPFAGLGVIVGAAVSKDIASAGIGAILKRGATAAAEAVAKRGHGSVDADGNFTPTGNMAAVGAGAAVGIGLATFIVTTGIFNFEKREAEMQAGGEELKAARAAAAAGDSETLQRLKNSGAKRLESMQTPGFLENTIQGLMGVNGVGWLGEKIKPGSTAKFARAAGDFATDGNRDTAANTQEAYLEEIRKLQRALDANTRAVAAGGGGKGGAPAPEASRTAPIVSPSRG
jgi:hypothetical protein